MKRFKKSDIIITISILVIALLSLIIFYVYNKDKHPIAEIYYKTELIKTIDLEKATEEEFSIPQAPEVIIKVTDNHEIMFLHSDCPDKVCIKSGKLHKSGQSAACLPNNVIIKITSDDEKVYDIVIGK